MHAAAAGILESQQYRFHTMPETSYYGGIHSIAKDRVGRMWFSSYDAVYMYNGNSFDRVDGRISSMRPESNWNFGQVACDAEGNLYVASNRGLVRYDYRTDSFMAETPGNIGPMAATPDGTLWFILDGVVCSLKSGEVSSYPLEGCDPSTLTLMSSASGHVYVASGGDVFCLDRSDGTYSHFTTIDGAGVTVKDVEECSGAVYVLTLLDGVFEYDHAGSLMRHFSLPSGYEKVSSAKELYADASGIIWTATQSGLLMIDSMTGDTRLLRSNLQQPFSLPNNSVWTIYPDPDGGVWVGTYGGKLAYCTESDGDVEIFFKAASGSLSSPIVSCFAEDSDGRIWIGTEGGGINIWDRQDGTFSYYTQQDGCGLRSNMVKHLSIGQDGTVWVSSFNGGVQKLAPGSSRFTDVCTYLDDGKSVISAYDFLLDGRFLWMTDPDVGLMRMEVGGQTAELMTVTDESGQTVRMRPETLFMGHRGRLWVVTHSGAYELDPETCRVVSSHLTQTGVYSADNLCSVCAASDGSIWFGTRGGGVNRLSPDGTYGPFAAQDGNSLNGKSVFGILEDEPTASVWFSTNDGLYVFADGTLQRSQIDNPSHCGAFYARSCFKTSQGSLLFGSTDGFLMFNPGTVRFNSVKPRVYFTDLLVNDRVMPPGAKGSPLDCSVSAMDEDAVLKLSHRQNNIEVRFSCNSYLKSENNRFAYRMKGLSDKWVTLPAMQKAVQFFGLPAGRYVLEVRASNNDGVWGDETAALHFRVRPSPFASQFAYLVYLLLVCAIAYATWHFFTARRLLRQQLEVEKMKERNARELDQARMKFFTNISHDLKTPLTLVLGPLRQMKEKIPGDSEARQYVDMVENNVNRIQRTIGQLLQFREIESQKLTMNPRPGDLVALLRDIFSLFEFYANKRHIEMEFASQQESLQVLFDPDVVEKIFTNLFSNAIKYTPEGNFIGVRISSLSEDGVVTVDVTNTGVEIPADRAATIFDAFSKSSGQDSGIESSTGLGLAIVKELVDNIGGSVSLDSSDMKVTFRVRLPLKTATQVVEHAEDSAYDYAEAEIDNLLDEFGESDEESEAVSSRKANTVVVVEDDAALRRYLKQCLSERYNVYTAHDGEEGIGAVQKYQPQLVVTDLAMPQMDGFDLCGRIRADIKTSHIPVIVLSGQGGENDSKVRALESGANLFIDKPVDVGFLLKQMDNLLKNQEQMREFYSKKYVAEPSNLTITSMDENLLRRAMECIEKNIDNNEYDVNEFVSDMAVGRTLLYQKIKDITGMSIKEFIMDIRLKRAAQLLRDSDLTIAEISDMTGFANPKYFSICFKRHFDLTPSEFKHQG